MGRVRVGRTHLFFETSIAAISLGAKAFHFWLTRRPVWLVAGVVRWQEMCYAIRLFPFSWPLIQHASAVLHGTHRVAWNLHGRNNLRVCRKWTPEEQDAHNLC